MSNQIWKLKYFEKNRHESHINIFRSLEIENYLKQSLKKYNFKLHDYKLSILNTRIDIFLIICEKTRTQNQKKNWKQISLKLLKAQKNICYFCSRKIAKKDIIKIYQTKPTSKLGKKTIINKNEFHLIHTQCEPKKTNQPQTLIKELNNKKIRTTFKKLTNSNNQFKLIYKHSYRTKPLFTNFFQNLMKSIRQLTERKFTIVLKAKLINEKFFQKNIKYSLLELKHRFRIPEMKQLYLILLTKKYSAELLSIFITTQLKTTKRHNFFFNILLQNLILIMKQKYSKIKGIKILFKGRLNNAPRSRNRIIKLGKIPIIKQNVRNDYAESVSITSNGTIGVKVWINQENEL